MKRLPGTLTTRRADYPGNRGRLGLVGGDAVRLACQSLELGEPQPGSRIEAPGTQPRSRCRPVGAPTRSNPRAAARTRDDFLELQLGIRYNETRKIPKKKQAQQSDEPTHHTVAHLIAWRNYTGRESYLKAQSCDFDSVD